MKQKLFLFCLALVCSANIFAHDFEVGGIYYNFLDDGGVAVTYQGSSFYDYDNEYTGDVVIPATTEIDGVTYRVTTIGESAFSGCTGLSSIVIPNTITTIEGYAFNSCSNLTEITIPNSVQSIGMYAFYYTNLTEIYIPSSVTDISYGIVLNCPSLTSIVVDTNNPSYYSQDNCLIHRENQEIIAGCNTSIIPTDGSIRIISTYAFGYLESLTSIVIPDGVTAIYSDAFENCSNLTSVVIPNSVNTISGFAFYQCNLTNVTIGDGVTSIEGYTFANNENLETITIHATKPPYLESTAIASNVVINVPCGSVNAYKQAENWSAYTIESLGEWGYTFSVLSEDETMGSVAILQEPSCDDNTAIIKAMPVEGYQFKAWNDGSTENPRTITITDNVFISATFKTIASTPETGIENGHEYVDLGLPSGLLWATCNVGAGSPEEYGAYFAWGETTTKDNYAWINTGDYKYGVGMSEAQDYGMQKYNSNDNIITLEAADDGASVNWGGAWRTPTLEEQTELRTHCDWEWITLNGTAGWKISSKAAGNTNSIFLPAAGYRDELNESGVNEYGYYWSSSVYAEDYGFAYCLNFYSEGSAAYEQSRYCGLPIRSVCKIDSNPAGSTCLTYTILGGDSVSVKATNTEDCTGKVVIPATTEIDGVTYRVTTIDVSAFAWCTGITSIELPSSISSIRYGAFAGCENLTSIDIPNGVQRIEGEVFWLCKSLNSITIPRSVTDFVYSAVHQCPKLERITVEEGNTVYHSENNCLIATDSKRLLTGCKNSIIPSDGSVTTIDSYAFYGCIDLTTITINNHITFIGAGAFSYCSGLESIIVEEGNAVYHSENNCLIETATKTLHTGCKNSIIPTDGSVTKIGDYAFVGQTGLTSITLPDYITEIGRFAFVEAGLTDITIPNSVNLIGEMPFNACYDLSYNKYENALYLGNNENPYHALILGRDYPNYATTIHEQTKVIAGGAFKTHENITSIVIPEGVISIGTDAFYECYNLSSVTLPSTLTTIDGGAFMNTNLTSITIPQNVAFVGNYAFAECENLVDFTIEAITPPALGWMPFGNLSSNATFTVPCEALENYRTNAQWYEYAHLMSARFDYTLTVLSANEEQGIVNITQQPDCTTDAIFEAVANSGYSFKAWSDGNTENPRTLTVTDDIVISAIFQADITVELYVNNLTLHPGESYYLNITIQSQGFDKSTLLWSSDNSDIASVANGLVSAHQAGTATITVSAPDNTPLASCVVYVVNQGDDMTNNVVINPSSESVEFSWPAVDNASSYIFIIYADAAQTEKICTLTFDEHGYLTRIDFLRKPSATRDAQRGFNFVVTGLESNTTYTYTLDSYDSENTVIDSKAGQFTTTSNVATGVETLLHNVSGEVHKVLENGTIYILRNGKKYAVDGSLVE